MGWLRVMVYNSPFSALPSDWRVEVSGSAARRTHAHRLCMSDMHAGKSQAVLSSHPKTKRKKRKKRRRRVGGTYLCQTGISRLKNSGPGPVRTRGTRDGTILSPMDTGDIYAEL